MSDRTPTDVTAEALWGLDYSYPAWDLTDDEQRARYRERADVVLAALGPDDTRFCSQCEALARERDRYRKALHAANKKPEEVVYLDDDADQENPK